MNPIDSFLSRQTMYRLMLSLLGILAVVSIFEAFLGWLPYTALDLLLSLVLLVFATQTANALCTLFTRSATNPESAFITAFILFFILTPLQSASDALMLIIAGAIAMLSKYVLGYGKVHIFNPAAFAVFVTSVAGTGLVSWWIGTPLLFPFVLCIGLLVVRKVRRFDLLCVFLCSAVAVFVLRTIFAGTVSNISQIIPTSIQFITSTPLIFFGALMLTDPQTSPSGKGERGVYAALVGILFSLSALLSLIPLAVASSLYGGVAVSPELALLVGNVFAFVTGKRKRKALSLQSSKQLSKEVFEFTFLPSTPLFFKPGQYAEWMLPHKSPDNRGVRRYFAITSAPSEHVVRFSTSMPVESSTFKDALRALKKEDEIIVTNILGDFILPQDPDQKILMIAGGMGISPFVSMFRHLAEQHERRDMVLIYSALTPLDFVYEKEIEALKDSIGLQVIYLPIDFTELSNWSGASGNVTPEFIEKEIPDYKTRAWYLSGSEDEVRIYKWIAKTLGVSKTNSLKLHL